MLNIRSTHLFISLLILAFAGAACSGWLRSPSRDLYKQAQDQWDKGSYTHALYLGSKAVVSDPAQWRPKRFLNDHFDQGIKQTKQYLEQTQNPTEVAVADQRHQTYTYLVDLYANIEQMKLPLKHKDKFSWETEIVDYTDELEAARKEAVEVHFESGERLLSDKIRESVGKAANLYSKAIKEYATSEEKETLKTRAFTHLKTHGDEFGASQNLKEAISAHEAYALALHFKASEEVKTAADKVRLHVSDLYVTQGKKLEAKADLNNLINASDYYKAALNWNEENEAAQKLAEQVKPKVAEIYYQKGLAIQKSKDRDLIQAKTHFKNATEWVPDYKDAFKRFRVFDILVEIQEVQPKLEETIAEHDRFTDKIGPITKSVNAAAANVGTIVEVSGRFNETNKAIKNVNMALTTIKPIPYVGVVASGVSVTLKTIQIPVKTGIRSFKSAQPVMKPTVKMVNKTKGSMDALIGQIASSTTILASTQEIFATAESCLMEYEREDRYDDYAAGVHYLNEGLPPLNASLKTMNDKLDELGMVADQMAEYTNVFNEINNYFDKIDPTLNSVNGTAEDILNALDKDIGWNPPGPVNLTINVKDALNKIDGLSSGLQDELLKVIDPLLDELGVEMPSFPYMDQMDEVMAATEKTMTEMKEKVDAYYEEYEKYKDYKKRIYNKKNDFKSACFGPAYFVQSAKEYGKSNKGYWDIPGWNPYYKKDQTIQVYEEGKYGDRKFHIEKLPGGYVRITAHHGVGKGYLDVSGGNTKNGTDIQLWDKNGSNAQKFKLKEVDEGVYKIYTAKGQVLALAGRSTKNSTNVHIWEDHDVPAVKWVFVDPKTKEKVQLEL